MTDEAERSMAALTERLIDAVLALGGSYYLPYRLHARGGSVARRLSAASTNFWRKAELRSAAALPQHDVGEVFRYGHHEHQPGSRDAGLAHACFSELSSRFGVVGDRCVGSRSFVIVTRR